MKTIAQIAREEDLRAWRRSKSRVRRPFVLWLASRAALVATCAAIAWVSWVLATLVVV